MQQRCGGERSGKRGGRSSMLLAPLAMPFVMKNPQCFALGERPQKGHNGTILVKINVHIFID